MKIALLGQKRAAMVGPRQRWRHIRAALQLWWHRPTRRQWDRAFAQAFTGVFSGWAALAETRDEGQAFVAGREVLATRHSLLRPEERAESAVDLYEQAKKLLRTALETTPEGREIMVIYQGWQQPQT